MTVDQTDIGQIHDRVQKLRQIALELRQMGADFPAVARNSERILASVKMLEIGVSDAIELAGYQADQ